MTPSSILAICAVVGLLLNIVGLAIGYFTLVNGHKLIQAAQDAIWSEILAIKKALGLADGGTGKYVTKEHFEMILQSSKDAKERLDSHSTRLRDLEISAATGDK